MAVADHLVNYASFTSWIRMETEVGKENIKQQLREWIANPVYLTSSRDRFQHVQTMIQRDPAFAKECDHLFHEIAEIEKKLTPLTVADSKLEKESYNELLFVHPLTRPFNFVPLFLTLWSFLRIYLLPGISFLFPLLTLIAPYFILTYLFHIPITFKNYMNLLHSMISGNIQAVLHPDASVINRSLDPVAFLKQGGIVLLTVVQGIIQPYWSYKHLNSIDNIIQDHGGMMIRFRNLYCRLESLLATKQIVFFRCPIPILPNERIAMAHMLTDSFSFKMALKYIGSFECLFRLANTSALQPVRWISSKSPVFRLKDTFDYQVPEDRRKCISVQFDSMKGQHTLLTGPNKGGKSTALRAIAMSALLAHTYGCAIGTLTATPLSTIHVCLKPDDLPGSKSRFEREIEFTANTLHDSGRAMILIDELYHSTNPPDALRSCEIYSAELWKRNQTISVISTHLFDWVHKAPEAIQRLCCPAEMGEEKGEIKFSYELVPGVCTVSSVDSLLQSNGFSL